MRYLGIDYGTKRVGVAVSDESGMLAFPYTILENDKALVGKVKAICEKEKIEQIIVGESVDYKGNPNIVMEAIGRFAEELHTATDLLVSHEREFLSTQQARFFQPDKKRVDDSAAAIILQSYLDKKNVKPLSQDEQI
jgi:putative Holliday junction resolvase